MLSGGAVHAAHGLFIQPICLERRIRKDKAIKAVTYNTHRGIQQLLKCSAFPKIQMITARPKR